MTDQEKAEQWVAANRVRIELGADHHAVASLVVLIEKVRAHAFADEDASIAAWMRRCAAASSEEYRRVLMRFAALIEQGPQGPGKNVGTEHLPAWEAPKG